MNLHCAPNAASLAGASPCFSRELLTPCTPAPLARASLHYELLPWELSHAYEVLCVPEHCPPCRARAQTMAMLMPTYPHEEVGSIVFSISEKYNEPTSKGEKCCVGVPSHGRREEGYRRVGGGDPVQRGQPLRSGVMGKGETTVLRETGGVGKRRHHFVAKLVQRDRGRRNY